MNPIGVPLATGGGIIWTKRMATPLAIARSTSAATAAAAGMILTTPLPSPLPLPLPSHDFELAPLPQLEFMSELLPSATSEPSSMGGTAGGMTVNTRLVWPLSQPSFEQEEDACSTLNVVGEVAIEVEGDEDEVVSAWGESYKEEEVEQQAEALLPASSHPAAMPHQKQGLVTAAAATVEGGAQAEAEVASLLSIPLPSERGRCGTFGCTLPDRHTGLHRMESHSMVKVPSASIGAARAATHRAL